MRLPLLVMVCGLASLASADRLINVPTARKVLKGIARYEISYQGAADESVMHRLAYGVDSSVDVEFRTGVLSDPRLNSTFNAGYQYLAAVPGVSPGISMGIVDALNRSDEGRKLFVALTFREAVYTPTGESNLDITLGVFALARSAGFVGLYLPFTREVAILAEHDGLDISAGFEYRPAKTIAVRWITAGNRNVYSLSFSRRL
ncbi:MAG: hypothetical protein ACOYON_06950 [Fimbriimonas sp.]